MFKNPYLVGTAMKKISILLILCLMVQPAIALQASNTDWETLQSISTGHSAIVRTVSGKNIKGQFRRVTESTMELNMKSDVIVFQRAEVSRVYLLSKYDTRKSVLIGAGLGVASGVSAGAASNRNSTHLAAPGWVAVSLGGGVCGAVIGLTVGKGMRKKELVYSAR